MVCLGIEPGAAGWKAQTNPLSYGILSILNTYGAISYNRKSWFWKNCSDVLPPRGITSTMLLVQSKKKLQSRRFHNTFNQEMKTIKAKYIILAYTVKQLD